MQEQLEHLETQVGLLTKQYAIIAADYKALAALVMSATNRYSPALSGDKEHTCPVSCVPGICSHGELAPDLLCQYDEWIVYVTPLMLVLEI